MLSKTSSRLLRFTSKWTSFFGGMPFEWDSRRSKLKISQVGWAKWTFWVAYLLFNWGVSGVKLVVAVVFRGRTEMKKQDTVLFIYGKVKTYQITIVYLILALMYYNTWHHLEDIVCFINSFIRYSQHCRNSFKKRLNRGWRNGCEGLLRGMVLFMLLFPVLPTLLYISDPNDNRYVTSLLPPPPITPKIFYISFCLVFGFLHTVWVYSAFSTLAFYVLMCVLVSYVTFQMLREIKEGHRYYVTRPVLRRPPRLCELYRSLQILNRLWNNALASCNFPMKVSSQLVAIVANVSLIKFHKMESCLSLVMMMLGPNLCFGAWLLLIHLYGQIYKKSSSCINSWQHLRLKMYRDCLIMRKFRKSAAPLKISVGGVYFAKPIRVIVTLHSVFRSTLKMLLSIQKKLQH